MNGCRVVFALLFALAFAAPLAHADTIMPISGTLTDGGSFSGTVTFDPTAGTFTASDFTVTDGVNSYVFDVPFGHGGTGNDPFSDLFLTAPFPGGFAGALFILDVPGTTPLSSLFTGATICSTTYACAGTSDIILPGGGGTIYVESGSVGTVISSISAVPEPSSLFLLGTGLICMCGVARRKIVRV